MKTARIEPSDARPQPLLLFAGLLALFSGLVFLGCAWLLSLLRPRAAPPSEPTALAVERPLEPVLQSAPARALAEHRRREQEQLDSYGWVDRENGVVSVPLERALELALERGFPVREAPEGGGR